MLNSKSPLILLFLNKIAIYAKRDRKKPPLTLKTKSFKPNKCKRTFKHSLRKNLKTNKNFSNFNSCKGVSTLTSRKK